MIRPATPAEDEKACIGTEASPRASGQRRRHHRARHSAPPPITSKTSRGASNPRPTWSASAEAPTAVASRNSMQSTTQSRCERRGGGSSSSSGVTNMTDRRRRALTGLSVGIAPIVEHPTEVDAHADFRRPNDRPTTDCASAGRGRSWGLSFEKGVSMLARLAHAIAHHRKAVIVAWLALTLFGGFSASQVSHRWLQSFSIPGAPAYEASQRTLERFGTGDRPPNVVVFETKDDVTKSEAIPAAMERALNSSPGARSSSFFSTGSYAYVSKDRHTTFMELYPAGAGNYTTKSGAEAILAAAKTGLPAGVAVHVTGHHAIMEANEHGETGGTSVLVEALIGGLGALVILFFVFGTLPAVLLPIVIAVSSILNTFTLVWILTYITDVSIVVQFLIALVGLGVAIDYALLMIFRFRDELRQGKDGETALVETMTHAGK